MSRAINNFLETDPTLWKYVIVYIPTLMTVDLGYVIFLGFMRV